MHPIVEADFPDAPRWLDECLGTLFEAPTFGALGEIHGAAWNRRYPRKTSGTRENKYSTARTAIHAYAPLHIHPAQQLFAGLGPSFSIDLSDTFTFSTGFSQENRNRAAGLGLVVGGWL